MQYFNLIGCLLLLSENVWCDHEESSETFESFPKKEYSLIKPYQGFGIMSHWDFFGSTILTSNYIRLTPDKQSRFGGLWNQMPLNFPNWEVHLQFKIHGNSKSLFGDGLAFWYLTNPLKSGPIFGSSDYFSGLSISIDTYANQNNAQNHGYPYISAMVNNGTVHYDYENDGSSTTLTGCEAILRNVAYDTYLLIRYDNDQLIVKTDTDNDNQWKECFAIKHVHLPTDGFIGLSASTGELTDIHDIISLKIYELELKPNQKIKDRSTIIPSVLYFNQQENALTKPKLSNFSLFLIIFFVIVGTIFLSVMLYLYWQSQYDNHKRFY